MNPYTDYQSIDIKIFVVKIIGLYQTGSAKGVLVRANAK
jgi:hypothetical protein